MASTHRPVKRLIDACEPEEGKAQIIERPRQLTGILCRASRGEIGVCNVAITWMFFGSGKRINEVAQLKVKDVFRLDGSHKKAFTIPASYAKTNKFRIAYIVVPQHRRQSRAMISGTDHYAGLVPGSSLFLSENGIYRRKFAFNVKKYSPSVNGEKNAKETMVCRLVAFRASLSAASTALVPVGPGN